MKRKVQRLDTVHLKTEVYGDGIVQTTNGFEPVAKAIVARKSLGQKCPCGFDSRPRHKKQQLFGVAAFLVYGN